MRGDVDDEQRGMQGRENIQVVRTVHFPLSHSTYAGGS